MAVYRIADVTVAYTPKSAYMDAFLSEYLTTGQAAVTLSVSPSAIEAESARLLYPDNGVQESAAVLRALGRCLPFFDRLLLHAATVVFDGNAYAFIAPPGTGKTTHVTHWAECVGERAFILNGDKLILQVAHNTVTAYGNPWRGKEHLGRDGSAPLSGIVVLTRSDRSVCRPISPADALPHLLRATPIAHEREERLCVLALLEQLTTLVPLYHLETTPTADAVKAVLTVIGGSL